MKYFSMFSGIGGFELGIQRAFDGKGAGRFGQKESISESDSTNASSQSNERQYASCIGYSEIDKYAIKVYEKQFKGEHKNYGDATTINSKQLPDFDLLVGGFPCQAFSVAGKRQGFNDTRGTLFFDIARILSEKRPRHLLLENVKGLLNHDKGKTFQTILGVLSDLGYRVEWQVLNSKDFGVPQNRERIFIIGHLRGECSGKVFPLSGTAGKDIKVLGYLNSETWQKRNESIRRVYDPDGVAPTIPTGTGGGVMPKIVAQRSRDGEQQNEPRKDDNTNTLTSVQKDNLAIVNPKMRDYKPRDESPTLTASSYKEPPAVTGGRRIRRLTPIECERLQGFPDDWTKLGVGDEPISDTQRYKMCGNAVTVNVIEAIISEFDCL